MEVWPVNPLPAGLQRTPYWQGDDIDFDSGAFQSRTTFLRPLYRYTIPFQNFNEVKQKLLIDFWNARRGKAQPFLIKDPYDYRVDSVLAVRSGITTSSFRLFDTNSFFVRADTTTIGSLFSTLSGFVSLGSEFTYNQDTGVLNVMSKDATDIWGVRSMEYFRKVRFKADYQEAAVIWNVFNAQISLWEVN